MNNTRNRPPFAAGLIISAAAVVCAQGAVAQQRPAGNPCAIYGSDFVAVQGSGSCVRIGGRVRLEMGSGQIGNAYAPTPFSAPSPFPPQQQSTDGLNRAHMRLGGPGTSRR
jgi:hypothetical protein